jgi:hypothetical protein
MGNQSLIPRLPGLGDTRTARFSILCRPQILTQQERVSFEDSEKQQQNQKRGLGAQAGSLLVFDDLKQIKNRASQDHWARGEREVRF